MLDLLMKMIIFLRLINVVQKIVLLLKTSYVRQRLKYFSNNARIKSNVSIYNPECVEIHDGAVVGDNCVIWGGGGVVIGENVLIAANTVISSMSHEIYDPKNTLICSPITINKGAWIGANSTILPGVSIGENCVIAAGSVVNISTDGRTLYAGVPVSIKKNINYPKK